MTKSTELKPQIRGIIIIGIVYKFIVNEKKIKKK